MAGEVHLLAFTNMLAEIAKKGQSCCLRSSLRIHKSRMAHVQTHNFAVLVKEFWKKRSVENEVSSKDCREQFQMICA